MTTSKFIDISQTLKDIILEFIEDLRQTIFNGSNKDRGDLLLVDFFFRKMNPPDISSHVIKYILPQKTKIEKRDLEFFVENRNKIFGGLPQQNIDHFSDVISKASEEHLKKIWEYFDVIIELAEGYKKRD